MGSQRNRYSKISNLPTEILREIFLSACEYGLRWRDLASILKTCKHWYNVLAHDPAAYSTINFGDFYCNLPFAEFFARKSDPLPLNITWVDSGGSSASLASWKGTFFTRHIHRITTVQYAQDDLKTDRWLHKLPAPQLEQCSLVRFKLCSRDEDEDDDGDGDGSEHGDEVDSFFPEDHILPSLFGGNTPKLRALDLHQVRLAWHPGNYSDLTRLKITFRPELFARGRLDTDDFTIIFRNSPRLEHVELVTSGDEGAWVGSALEIPEQDHARPRRVMCRLHTLRLHLSVYHTIFILRAIEITTTIRVVDLYAGSGEPVDRRFLDALDTNTLPDFLFSHLRSLSVRRFGPKCSHYWRSTMEGTGVLDNHEYSLLVCHPFCDPVLLLNNFISRQNVPELRHIDLSFKLARSVAPLLAVLPAVDSVSLLEDYSYLSFKYWSLQDFVSGPRNHSSLAKVSHWAFSRNQGFHYGERPRLTQADVNALMAFFQHTPLKRRTISVDGNICLHTKDGRPAMQKFIVDLARLNVAIRGSVGFDIGWNHRDGSDNWASSGAYTSYSYTRAEELWSDGKVPEVVQRVMQQTDLVRYL